MDALQPAAVVPRGEREALRREDLRTGGKEEAHREQQQDVRA